MDDETQLAAIARLLRETLGDALLGAYLHGSTGTGRRRPTSDTDVLAITARPMPDEARRALVDGLLRISGRRAATGPARPVELTVAVARDLRPWRMPPTEDFQYGEWERDGYEAGELPARRVNPDLAPLVTMALDADRPLVGPPPGTLLDRVPPADLRAAVVAGIPGLLADLDTDTRNVLLTLARIWHTAETGRLAAKDEAGEWAIERLRGPCGAILRRAVDDYEASTHGSFGDGLPAARACADALAAAIRTTGA